MFKAPFQKQILILYSATIYICMLNSITDIMYSKGVLIQKFAFICNDNTGKKF